MGGKGMKESTIQQQTIEYLSMVSRQYNFMFFSVPNESLMTVLVAFKVPKNTCHRIVTFFKKMGMLPGVSDLVIIQDGKVYFIEMKNENGKQGDSQILFEQRCIDVNAPYAICRSVEEVQMMLRAWGVVE
jgi:hypothetical protein